MSRVTYEWVSADMKKLNPMTHSHIYRESFTHFGVTHSHIDVAMVCSVVTHDSYTHTHMTHTHIHTWLIHTYTHDSYTHTHMTHTHMTHTHMSRDSFTCCRIWRSHVPSHMHVEWWQRQSCDHLCRCECMWVMTRMKESCYEWMSHVTYEGAMSNRIYM